MAGRAATGWVVLAVLLLSLAPVALLVLDFLAERRPILGTKWFNLDLSPVDLARTAAEEPAVLPGKSSARVVKRAGRTRSLVTPSFR